MTRETVVPALRAQTWTVRHAGRTWTVAAYDSEGAARVWGWLALEDGDDAAIVRVEQGTERRVWQVDRTYDPRLDIWYVVATRPTDG